MACTSLAFHICRTSSASNAKHIFRAQNPSYCINRIHAASPEPAITLSLGSFPFQMSRNSIIPSLLRKQGTKIHMNMEENFGESTSDEGQDTKSTNWVDRLVELGGNWRNAWQQKAVSYHGDDFSNKGENGDCADPESFSRFLVRVPRSSVKLYSKLAFLCNMAYVIPDVKAKDLKKYYGLQFVTSSFEQKSETEKDFWSLQHSSPCEWFVCDDSSSSTRCFVIQGLESKASWRAYLLFEPTKFEGTNVLVHRGIYEAAKQMYEQCMPEILDHLERNGEQAKLQFTGHCLGGSIALLVHLMLLTRNLVKPTTLDRVVTFGSSFVFCEGHNLLDQLGLDESDHIHCVMMPRDIVPRAFSSNYGNQVAAVLRHVHSSFQSLPCLMKNNMLYSPVGDLIILQPDEKLSPPHPLLPMGNGIYVLDKTQSGFSSSVIGAFLNSPHPLETLSDPAAYGSEGTIKQDHDSSHYLKAINNVLRQHSRMVVRKMRKQRNLSWPLLYVRTWDHEDESKM